MTEFVRWRISTPALRHRPTVRWASSDGESSRLETSMTESLPEHPPVETLREFCSGILGNETSLQIEAHLESCEECCRTIASLGLDQSDRLLEGLRAAMKSESPPESEPPATLSSYGLLRRLQRTDDQRTTAKQGSTHPLGESSGSSTVPRMIARFEILDQLGEGAFGVVWRAFDTRLQRYVAIKIPRLASFASDQLRQRFLREAKATALLDHPNILPVYESGEHEELCYIASAYCAGPDLSEWLSRHWDPDPLLAAKIVASLAAALHHAHSRGVTHRDLKPANILLDPCDDPDDSVAFDFNPKITDFGLAKIQEDDSAATRSRCLLGTAGYMAPELARGDAHSVGPSADIYSVGCDSLRVADATTAIQRCDRD